MTSNWRSWCRLCANQDAVYRLESPLELNQIVHRYFGVTLKVTQHSDTTIICEECFNFINKLERFRERCQQTDKLFSELIMSNLNLLEGDLTDVRFRYGLENELHGPKTLKLDQSVDTSDLGRFIIDSNDLDIPEVKLEDDVVITESKKRRGRPKRNDGHGNMSIKNEPDETLSREDFGIVLTDDDVVYMASVASTSRIDQNDLENELHDDPSDQNFELDCADVRDDDTDDEDIPLQQKRKIKVKKDRNKKSKDDKSDENDTQGEFKCETCNKSFVRRQMYLHHVQKKHPDSLELPYVCSKCPKRFSTEKKVQNHELVHLPEDQKMVHPCPYCDKRFTKQVNVQSHVKAIHIGERPFVCEECGKSFGTKGALKEHQITHSEDRPFQCSHCPKKFKNLPRLKTHEDIHNDTMYVCPHCGLQLNTKRTLKMHMVVHSDQKKYKCQYCGNEYKRSKALKNHLILHTGLRPYHCPFCDKTFANGSNCRSHKKKSHPLELAALEASGEKIQVTNIPKLEHLQPKTHQIQGMQQEMSGIVAISPNGIQPQINNLQIASISNQSQMIKMETMQSPNPIQIPSISSIQPQHFQHISPHQQNLSNQMSLDLPKDFVPALQLIPTNNL